MTDQTYAVLALIVLLVLTVSVIGARIEIVLNRVRRLERDAGLDQYPPCDLERPPEEDTQEMLTRGVKWPISS